MKKSILAISIIASSLLLLTGCGGSSNNNEQAATTGTGYYVDSAVAGVNYTCGSKTGTTEADGAFTFEKGKDCTFTAAGIPLKTVSAADLTNQAKIVENNVTVARFLQSIDVDGNASNGIQITDKVLEILTDAIKNKDITKAVPKDTTDLQVVVDQVKQGDHDFKGKVKTIEEAQQHLKSTQGSVVKDLLAGKTFYVVGSADDSIEIFKFVVSSDGTQYKQYDLDSQSPTDSDSITYNGDKVAIGTGDGYTIFTQKNGYILGQDYGTFDSMVHRLYTSKADAQKYYNSLTSSNSSQDLKSLIVGKTYYVAVNDADPVHVETIQFKNDGKTMLDTWPKNGQEVTSTFTYSIANETLHITGTGGDGDKIDSTIKGPFKETATYVEFADGHFKIYKTKKAAEGALVYYHLQTSDIAGHTIKVGDPSKDKQYNADGTFKSLDSNQDTGTWSITDDGKLKHVWDSNGNVEIYYFAAKPATGVMLTNETYSQSAKITDYI